MSFGKYKGFPIDEIPAAYRVSLIQNTKLDADLEAELRASLARWANPLPTPPTRPTDLVGKLRSIRRRLAQQHHPDRAGDPGVMAGINLALDEVERALRAGPEE